MSDELKACPFCGSDDCYTRKINKEWFFVTCEECNATSSSTYTKQEAIDAWNKRSNGE